MSLSYSGINRRGVSTYGVPPEDMRPETLAEQLWHKGFRFAVIKNDHNREVGGVKRSEDPPHPRVWWAEAQDTGDPFEEAGQY